MEKNYTKMNFIPIILLQTHRCRSLIVEYILSSSSCRTGITDIPDPLSPLLPIAHYPRQVFRTTSRILT